MSNILRKQNRTMNCPAVTAGQIPYRNVTVKDKLDELDNRASANTLGTYVNITSYTETMYVVPSDGYLQLGATSTTSTRIRATIYGADGVNGISTSASYTLGNTFNSIFVRKGMKIKIVDNVNNGTAHFYPLEGSALPSAESEGF